MGEPVPELIGRDAELEAVRVFADDISKAPRALLLRGEPGIGKTALWVAGKALAVQSGARVLTFHAVQLEMPLGFGALGDLLEPILPEIEALPGPQRRALVLAAGGDPTGRPPPDRLAVSRAFLAAMRAMAEKGPVVLALDDLQWLDAPSKRVLSFALRRLGEERIGILATLRGGPDAPDPLELRAAFHGQRFREIFLDPLSPDALSLLVRHRFGNIGRPLLHRLYEASGGNPLFALEFARALKLAEEGRQPHILSIPASLRELIQHRVAAIPPDLRALVELVAALDRPTVYLLRTAFGSEPAEQLLDAAIDGGTLTVTADGVVRFAHPLIASAVYGDATPSRRRSVHRQAASLTDDEEERARHLALSTHGHDAEVAASLERAATGAAMRGALETAADLAGEAVEVTPPADADRRARRVLARAGYLAQAGDVRGAQQLLDPLLGAVVPNQIRTRALVARADCDFDDRTLLVDLLRQALEAPPDEQVVRWHVHFRYAQHGGWVSGQLDTAVVHAHEAVKVAEALGEPSLLEQSQLLLRYYEAAAGSTAVIPTPSIPSSTTCVPLPPWQVAYASPGAPLMWAGELAEAREVFAHQRERLIESGSILKLPFLLFYMTELEWRAGDWVLARQYAEEAADIIGSMGPAGEMVTAYVLALTAACSGRVDEARSIASGAIAQAKTQRDRVATFRNRWVLGLLELSLGDPARAWHSLDGLTEMLECAGVRNPGVYPFAPDAIEALIGLNRLDEAEALLNKLDTMAQTLRHRWATPAVQRSQGLLLLALGETEPALTHLDAAASGFALIDHPLDLARSQLAAGSALRRAGQRRRAADRLEEAQALFVRIGAPLWQQRCEQELRRARPRPRNDEALTAAEEHVARLVAIGRTNKEVAAELFTTVSTVEAHLTRIYRKVGVHRRSELTRLVVDGTLQLEAN